ncbi:MAG: phage tail tube protein [Paracoccaceae bacterium]
MARAITEKYEEMILEVETITPGTYAKICGITDVTITRTANFDTNEIPDCDDESLPLALEKSVRSIDVKISGTGVWAQTSNKVLSDWFYSSAAKNIRLRNTKASVGDPETEAGPALLTALNNSRTKGQRVTSEIEIEMDGVPTRTNKAA